MAFGLSTSWNASRTNDGKELIFEIKEAGFSAVELGFNLTAEMVRDIAGLVAAREIEVLSLHNFCPIPDGLSRPEALPDCYSLASLKEETRELALKYTKRTINTAKALGARAVVLHNGRVEISEHTRKLIGLYENNLYGSPDFTRIKAAFIKERKARSGRFFENTLKSLDELNRYAGEAGISLGIENRFYYSEIPSFEEIDLILKEFSGGKVFYWHDVGHAQVMERLGFWQHAEFLQSYGSEMLGVHLHNVTGCRDHQVPQKGDFDFKRLKPYLKKETLKIIEAHGPATLQDLIQARDYLEGIFNG